MAQSSVTIVSLTWNSERFVEPFLSTTLRDIAESQVEAEVVVIDNGSSDGTLPALFDHARRDSKVRVVPLGRNVGTTISRNIGLRMAQGEFVFVLDSDTELAPGTLRGLVEGFRELPESAGMLCPRLVYPDGEFQESARRFPTVFTKAYRLLGTEEWRRRDESIPAVLEGRRTPVDYAISAAWFLPRRTLERVGYLDETIFFAPEDVEYCARMRRHGLEIWYDPDVEIVHNCQRLTNKKPFSKLGLLHARDLARYWVKYGALFRRP